MTSRQGRPLLEVNLWLADPDDFEDDDLLDETTSPLSNAERRRALKIRHAATRSGYLVGRLLVRTALSQFADVLPTRWEIIVAEGGKPRLGPTHAAHDLRFNLSHTNPLLETNTDSPNALVACAICRGSEVGVDIEDVRRRSATDEIAHRFFSTHEVDSLFRLDRRARRRRFFDLWTLKESYIKARGKGMAIPLGSFSFNLDAPGKIGFEATAETGDTAQWRFALLSPTPDHRLALAVERRDERKLQIEARQMGPSGDFEYLVLPLLRSN